MYMVRRSEESFLESNGGASSASRIRQAHPELLAFRAPYLEQKLLTIGVVRSEEEARSLFLELKRYFVLAARHPSLAIPMFSLRVDRAWHEFILFTERYTDFCFSFAGAYLHHEPAGAASAPPAGDAPRDLAFAEFRMLYEAVFGALPSVWHDDLAVALETRLGWAPSLVRLSVDVQGERARLIEDGEPLGLLCRASLFARPALEFIARHRFFHVRELPHLGRPERAVQLVRPLVRCGVLQVTD